MLLRSVWFARFMIFTGYLMVAIYISLGVVILTTNVFQIKPVALKFSISLFLIAYGFFRLVKMLNKKSEPNE